METKFLDCAEGRLAYDDRGRGPLVICVPGMGDSRAQYRFLAPLLVSAGYRVVTMDLRGHGESSVAGWTDYSVAGVGTDILALARELAAGPVVLVGNSMAAGAAVWAAAESPESIRGLVMIGPAVRGELGLFFRLLLRVLFARPWGPSAWLRYVGTLFPSRLPPDWERYSAALKSNLAEPGRLEALGAMMRASKRESESRLGLVGSRALVVMGSRDPDFPKPVEEADWVAARLHARVQIIEGAGHYPHVEHPETVAPRVIQFLEAPPEVRADAASVC